METLSRIACITLTMPLYLFHQLDFVVIVVVVVDIAAGACFSIAAAFNMIHRDFVLTFFCFCSSLRNFLPFVVSRFLRFSSFH